MKTYIVATAIITLLCWPSDHIRTDDHCHQVESADRIHLHEIPPPPSGPNAPGASSWLMLWTAYEEAQQKQREADQAWRLVDALLRLHVAEVGRLAEVRQQDARFGQIRTFGTASDSVTYPAARASDGF
jgi:hypothetical protein